MRPVDGLLRFARGSHRLGVAPIEDISDTSEAEFSRALRRFLKIEDRRLRMRHQIGDSGLQTAVARSFVLDLAVQHAFQFAVKANASPSAAAQVACALIASGGYGRAELAPTPRIR